MVHVMLLSMLHGLYFYIITYRRMCAVPNVAVFCISLIACFLCMLLRYSLDDFEFSLPLLLLVPLLILHFTCTVFL